MQGETRGVAGTGGRGRNDGRWPKLCEGQLHVTADVRRHLGPLGTVTSFPGMRRKTGAAGQTIKAGGDQAIAVTSEKGGGLPGQR